MLSWLGRNTVTNTTVSYSDIHWLSYKKARKESSFGLRRFITKWIGKSVATGKVMVRRTHRVCSNCPICKVENEDQLHVLTCPAPTSQDYRAKLLIELASWFQSTCTNSRITNFFLQGLKIWFQDHTSHFSLSSNIFTADSDDNVLLLPQLQLGWYNTLCGLLSPSLIYLQHAHYTNISSKRSGSR